MSIKRLVNLTAPYLWDYKAKDFVPNPNGQYNSALYIGTELELNEEIKPMMWAFVSGVEEDKIRDNDLTEEEEYRVDKAIEILENTQLYTERESNFGLAYLWQTIEEYKVNYNIRMVEIDYIELTPEMIREYALDAKGMGIREDQVLLNLSANLKDMADKYDVLIDAWTQVSDGFRTDGQRNQSAIKGAKALPNKADVGTVEYEPSRKELEKLAPIIEKLKGLTHKEPNICYSFYKNRGGKIKNVKIWGWQNLGNMEYHDLFCTNHEYELINVDKTFVNFLEDEEE